MSLTSIRSDCRLCGVVIFQTGRWQHMATVQCGFSLRTAAKFCRKVIADGSSLALALTPNALNGGPVQFSRVSSRHVGRRNVDIYLKTWFSVPRRNRFHKGLTRVLKPTFRMASRTESLGSRLFSGESTYRCDGKSQQALVKNHGLWFLHIRASPAAP